MKKRVVSVLALDTGAPYSLCVCYGDMIYVAGLPPFDADLSKKLREARASGSPQSAFAGTQLQTGRLPMSYIPTD
jgi:enamine deaminase RidA (YjgF/YER057c/UK114 family)